MSINWPLGTRFTVERDGQVEHWQVGVEANLLNGIVSADSPLGSSLLNCLPEQHVTYTLPNNEQATCKIINIKPPKEDDSCSRDLIEITTQISNGQTIRKEDVEWLEKRDAFDVLAYYYEQKYYYSLDANEAVNASKYWRKAKNPNRSLEITSDIEVTNPHTMSRVFTTRGGAYRDLKQLKCSKKCAREAIRLNPESYHPHNLLGALHLETGNIEEGEEEFAIARELGSPLSWQEKFKREALRRAC